MLVLSRDTDTPSEMIGSADKKDVLPKKAVIGITIVRVWENSVRLGFYCGSKEIAFQRREIFEAILKEPGAKKSNHKEVLIAMHSTSFPDLKEDDEIVIGLEDQEDVIDVNELVEANVLCVTSGLVNLEIRHPEGLSVLKKQEYDLLIKQRALEAKKDDKAKDQN
jgi:sRNA-binding carbon storage regulator CsrA